MMDESFQDIENTLFEISLPRPGDPAMSEIDIFVSTNRSFDVDTVEKLLTSDLEIEYRSSAHPSLLYVVLEPMATKTSSFETAGFEEKSNNHLDLLCKSEVFQRMVNVFLESGRFNVIAFTDSSQTVLHFAVYYCNCEMFQTYAYKDLMNAIIELLLKNNSNVNVQKRFGETPLMKASELGCSHIVQILLEWRDELGAGVDLNARDIYGETALIKAAKHAHVDVVKLLLNYGCLDEFQDNRGFYALHAAIYGPHSLIDGVSSDFLQSIGVDASEQTIKVLDQYGADILGGTIRYNLDRNNGIQKIVRMLVTIGRSEVNSLDFRSNTVLDMAVKSKLGVSQGTLDMLIEFGAKFCVLMNTDSEHLEHTFQTADKLGRTPLHRLSAAQSVLYVIFGVYDLAKLLNSSPFKELVEAMTVRKDHRGRTALHYAVTTQVICSNETILLINAIKLAHILNEKDNYGRTPLHYCEDESVYESLVKEGADENVQDIDAKTPQDFKQLRKSERNSYNNILPLEVMNMLAQLDDDECEDDESNDVVYDDDESKDEKCKNSDYKDDAHKEWTDDKRKLENQSIPRKIDAWMICTDSKYAYRDQFWKRICDEVRQFMNRLAVEIRRRHARFECRPVLIGSADEETKIGLPDEFDFNFIPTKFSEVCQIVPSPEAPSGFVHLKRRSCAAEYKLTSQGFQSQEGFHRFFNSSGFLLTTEIASRFRILYLQAMSEPEFWNGENVFEWDICNEVSLVYLKEEEQYDDSKPFNDFKPWNRLSTTIQLKLNRIIEGRYMFKPISVDIVPCIQLDDWWPEKAHSGANDEIKQAGCHLLFDQPQKKYPWVPFSEPFARISFAPAESRLIKECSAVARAAYMVCKQLLYYYHQKPKLTYVLKTCLLYCIEVLKDTTRNVLFYEDIDQTELRFFVEKLMLCFHRFYQLNFLRCYLMPSFHHLNGSRFQYPLFAYELHSIVCITKSPIYYCDPNPDRLTHNREKILRMLSIN